MRDLTFYLMFDHPARQRVTLFSVTAGALAGGLIEWMKAPMTFSFTACIVVTVVVELIGALRYTVPKMRIQRKVIAIPVRHRLIRIASLIVGIAASVIISFWFFERFQATSELERAQLDTAINRQESAAERIQRETESVKLAAQTRKPAPPSFFEVSIHTAEHLRTAGVSEHSIQGLLVQLAQYRSTLTQLPKESEYWKWVPMEHGIVTGPNGRVEGGMFDATNVSGDLIVNDRPDWPGSMPYFHNTVIKGGVQLLDNFEWDHVLFIGTKIRYAGGPVKLENGSRFVNCTLDLPLTENGSKVATYITLLSPSLEIPSSTTTADNGAGLTDSDVLSAF